MKLRQFYVYILTNFANTTLYIGITNDLTRRLYEHRSGKSRFTSKYKLIKLVYYEITDTAETAIAREKQLKKWHRPWKIELIEAQNPGWKDLALEWAKDSESSSE